MHRKQALMMCFEPLNRDCDGVIVLVRAWEIETYVTVASASYIVPTTVAEFQFTQDIKPPILPR